MVTVQTKFQAVNEYKKGHAALELAEQYGVGVRSVFRWLKQFDGSLESLNDARARNGRERLTVTPTVEELMLQTDFLEIEKKARGPAFAHRSKTLVEKARVGWLSKKEKGKAST